MSFGTQMQKALDMRGMTRADLCRITGLKSGHLTPYIKDPDRDPRLSTALKVAQALNVSLDYLAGREDEMKPLRHDPSEDELVSLYRRCTPDRKRRALEDMRDRAEASVEAPGKVQGDSRRAV